MTPREEFLQKMYEEMFREIEHQIDTVWQAVATVFGSFAIVALAEKGLVSFEFGITVVVILCGWLIATVNECSYWYNRNLCIVSNIERSFLEVGDLRNISYYFGAHRPNNRMISQLKVQVFLATAVFGLVLLYHLLERVADGFSLPLDNLSLTLAMPYGAALSVVIALAIQIKSRNADYAEFLANSPGVTIDTSSVRYGQGHGY